MSTYLSKPADVEVIKNWILSLSPATADTTAPVITNFLPNGTQYPTTVTSAKLDITTNKDASCSFSLSAGNLDYSKMTKFNTTGAKVHSHMINNLKPGSYSYFVKCMDVAKNVSLHKEINFIIKSLISAPMPTKDQLRASVQ